MNWSEKAITWGCEDHPPIMPSPGGYAMVLDPTFVSDKLTCQFSRVLINAGSIINLLYRDTMEKLGITEAQLQTSRTASCQATPALPSGRSGSTFSLATPKNFRREPIWFEVVDIQSPYHSLLGHPALAKFMAVPHHAYLKMKMPGPKGVITIAGYHKRSLEYASAGSKLAESLVIAKEKHEIMHSIAMVQADMPAPRKPAGEMAF
jgi:hypothetical protein